MRTKTTVMSALTIIGMAVHAPALAQDLSADLAVSDTDDLHSALQTRYDAALTATRDNGTIAANDPRYMWASEAKVQCAIALGYLKSDTRDEPSISKCDYAYGQMTVVPQMPVAVIPPPPRTVAAPYSCRPAAAGNLH
ncbi:hypothetical protein [Erythrobacter sp. MTPC3]|uniref:hypothetical protein n=1 Tax=Erythrobacter sp. MTPC3 TaxID=3056564 RepID=UPI0036F2ACFC